MAEKYTSGFCTQCACPRKLQSKAPNHVLHLLLSIVTMGFWVIAWILVSISATFDTLRCSVCGSTKVKRSVPTGWTAATTHVRCPDCHEEVLAQARKCKHCGATLKPQVTPSPPTRSLKQPDRASLYAILACGLMAAALIGGALNFFLQ